MAKLTKTDKELILADYKAGISQNQLAKRYELSKSTINGICKGIEQENEHLANALIANTIELNEKSEHERTAIIKIVDEAVRRQNAVFSVTEKALRVADKLLDQTDTMSDVKMAVDLADRASLTLKVNDRHAPKIEVTQQNQTALVVEIE